MQSDDLVEVAIAAFNGGVVRVPNELNPRGYTDFYRPREAMRAVVLVMMEAAAKVADAEKERVSTLKGPLTSAVGSAHNIATAIRALGNGEG